MTEAAKAATSAADPGDASSGTEKFQEQPATGAGEKQEEVAADADIGGTRAQVNLAVCHEPDQGYRGAEEGGKKVA